MNWKKIALGLVGVAALGVGGWFAWPQLNPSNVEEKPFFANWGAVIVAGDWRASNGQPSDVFDNGRRDLAKKFIAAGFDPKNILQYSVQPKKFPGEQGLMAISDKSITAGLEALGASTPGGCLIYITSHGTHEGVVVGDRLVDPPPIAARIEESCGDRPTVAIISACYAGQFIGPLKGPKRIVFTAARADRSSFGCGEQDKYTFFDACVLSEFDKVGNFSDLATKVDECVRVREKAMKVDPPSEPQFFIGPEVTYTLNWK